MSGKGLVSEPIWIQPPSISLLTSGFHHIRMLGQLLTTLGESAYGNPNEDDKDEGITIPDERQDNDSAISLSSNESDLWNHTTETTGIIANITKVNENKTSKEEEIALLMSQIEALWNPTTRLLVNTTTTPGPPNNDHTLMKGMELEQPTTTATSAKMTSHPQQQQLSDSAEDGGNH